MALRVAFFGTPLFAVPTLDRLIASPHTVVGVVTQPDRPRGRGQRVAEGPVKACARSAGIGVLQPERLARDSFGPAFDGLDAEIAVVAAYGRLLPEWLLLTPRLGFLNVHASLLPRYRGASPVHHAVMAGDAETGVTIMQVVKALDAGPMLAKVRVPIGADETSVDVERRLAAAGAALLVETLSRIENGSAAAEPQADEDASYAPRLTRADGDIDWSRDARSIHNQVRGLHPWPHASTWRGGARLILHRTRPSAMATGGLEPGVVAAVGGGDGLVVATGAGGVELLEVQPEGGRVMPASAYLAGHPMHIGERFTRSGPRSEAKPSQP
jgi:methionyl-tRNA formyltransferase